MGWTVFRRAKFTKIHTGGGGARHRRHGSRPPAAVDLQCPLRRTLISADPLLRHGDWPSCGMILEPGKTPLPKAQAPAKAGRRPPSWQARSGPPSPGQPGVRGALAAPPEEIVLDLDATDDPLHGSQEGRFFHGYYGNYCYLSAVLHLWRRSPVVWQAAARQHRCVRRGLGGRAHRAPAARTSLHTLARSPNISIRLSTSNGTMTPAMAERKPD